MKKTLLLFLLILFGCFLRPIITMAAEEQSVWSQLGNDGDCVIKQTLLKKQSASDGKAYDEFGNVVAISNNIAIVGTYCNSSAYIYERDEVGVWNQKQKLTASDGEKWDRFGFSVAISSNIAIVGAQYDDDKGSCSGSVYIYERNEAGVWSQKQKLTASDGATRDFFGYSVAIANNLIIVGAYCDDDMGVNSGSAYIFEQDSSGVWSQTKKLTASDGNEGALFGNAVSLNDNLAIVGSCNDDDKGVASGSAYVFERNSSGVWSQKQKLTASDGAQQNEFGDAVTIFGNVAIVGAHYANSAYIFEQNSSGVWSQKQKLTPGDGTGKELFGNAVGLSNKLAIIGSCGDDDKGIKSGSVYVFELNSSGVWSLKKKIIASEGDQWDLFGCSVGISGTNAIVGSRFADTIGDYSGSVYICNPDLQYASKRFTIPNDKKYLIFKVSRTLIISTEEALANKIRIEAVGFNRDTTNTLQEDAFQLTISNSIYYEGFTYVYYVVDVSELETKYIEACSSKLQLGDGGLGHFIYEQVGLRARYDVSTLRDVYVTDKVDIDSPEVIALDIESSQGGATITWSLCDSDIIQGYQVVVSTSSAEPTEAVDLTKLYTTPVAAYKNLSAKNQYYLWIRGVDTSGNVGPWTSKVFSPQPVPASFVSGKSIASDVDDQPEYSIKLKVTDVDAANYVIYRENSDGSEKIELDPVDYKSLATADFFCDGGSSLVKHETYTYSVYTTNALGEASTKSNNIVMKVANLVPKECTVTTGWRETEVNTKLSLQLGPVIDMEGDSLAYRVYVRTPGVDNEICVATLEPTTENETMTVDYTFTDKANYEWQVRCIERDISDASEVGSSAWNSMYIDTDAILIVAKNDFGVNTWGTKKQPLSFTIEKNTAKTYSDYQWYFNDDGTIAQGEAVTHTYYSLANETPYQLTVTAVDAAGVSHQGNGKIFIVNTPKGKLYDNEEWSGTLGISGLVIVPEGLTLTIAAGTTVQVNDAAGGFQVSGTLKAVDTAGAIAMDLQTDSDLWQGVKFQDAGWGILTGVTISHASQGVCSAGSGTIALENVTLSENVYGLYYSSGPVTANQCKFKYNTKAGVKFEGIADSADLTLTNCTFTGNTEDGLDEWGKIPASDLNEIGSNSGNESVEE